MGAPGEAWNGHSVVDDRTSEPGYPCTLRAATRSELRQRRLVLAQADSFPFRSSSSRRDDVAARLTTKGTKDTKDTSRSLRDRLGAGSAGMTLDVG